MSEPAPRESKMAPKQKAFQLLASAVNGTLGDGAAARLGRLTLPGRKPIDTPSYTAVASRGVVPHLTPDNVRQHTSVGAAYMALEDFIEKKDPPIYSTPPSHVPRLHSFTALPLDRATILGARRCPQITAPLGNGAKSLCIFTSTGFYNLTVKEYVSAIKSLQPDVVLPFADSLHTSSTPSSKKRIRMVERTEEWLDDFLTHLHASDGPKSVNPVVFAPILPVEHPLQWSYLTHLSEDVIEHISGLAISDVELLPELKAYKPLGPLPKLSTDLAKSPHEVLRQVSLGVDICTVGFVNAMSDAGVALCFKFPPPITEADTTQPLGMNMWSPGHNSSLQPLVEGCQCYACSKYHKAYLHHLLNAREMLGWSLLQIHNHHVVYEFFRGIRQVLGQGLAEFEQSRQQFLAAYEAALPQGTGDRPRARGYQFKSEKGKTKINKTSWGDLGNDSGAQFALPEQSEGNSVSA